MADLPIELDAALAGRLARALDVEGKIPRALESLGPVGGRDVLLVDGADGGADGIRATPAPGARRQADGDRLGRSAAPGRRRCVGRCRGRLLDGVPRPDPAEMAEAARVLRPGGRLLALHDYGRDDVSRLRGDRPEYGAWSRRDGPFLRGGFKIRVIHCFWTFDSIEDGQEFLDGGVRRGGRAVGAA